jgi:hypothetical protein
MSTSHYSRRDYEVGSDTIRLPIAPELQNRRKHTRLTANIWIIVGIMLLICDGTMMYVYADSPLEATIIALLSMPTGILVIIAALQARK